MQLSSIAFAQRVQGLEFILQNHGGGSNNRKKNPLTYHALLAAKNTAEAK